MKHLVLTLAPAFSGIASVALWLFNIYIDPKEQMSVGHRRNASLQPFFDKTFSLPDFEMVK